MAAPTEAEVQTQIGLVIQLLDEADKFARSNAKNVGGMYDGLIANPLEGDYTADVLAGMDAFRAQASGLMDSSIGRAMVDPLLQTYAKVRGFPETEPGAILARLFIDFIDNSKSVLERNFTFASPGAGGSNVGDGVLNRLNADYDGSDIENQTAELKTVKCIADEHSGAPAEHREIFEIRGSEPPRDFVAGIKGAQRIGSIQAIAADDSARFLTNPSFGQLDGTLATPTSIPGWTPTGGIGNFELVESPIYRGSTEEGDTPRAVKFTTNDTLVQNFNVNSVSFNPNVPYYLQIAWNRSDGTGDGTLTLTLGSQTESVALAAQSGWQILRIALGTKNWFQNWNQEDPTVSIQLASNTTGYVLVDDVVLAPFTNFDGGWYALVGGTTPFLYDDIFTFTDTEVGAIIQEWLWRLYGIYLPPAVTPTWADPA